VKAQYDGIIDRLYQQKGSLIKEGEVLTTLSDNSVMWVYFNVPEARYFEYKAGHKSTEVSQLQLVDSHIELLLANGRKFPYSAGNTLTIEGNFDNKTGNIPFRADFPNPDRLLRNGQTGTILLQQLARNSVVIPQRATFDILDKTYVYVVGEDHKVHQRPISILHEMDDIFVIKSGINVDDKIVFEGVRQVHEGQTIEYEFRKPEEALSNQKTHAE
jgi:membrane fusion protein (multidrug efflux system)